MGSKVAILPSILSADPMNLEQQIRLVDNADAVHVDVMDGHFVPNLTWGLPVAKAAADLAVLPTDVHLMIEDPDRWAVEYAQAGAETVTFHAEASTAPITLARNLRKAGAKAGIAFRPTTDVEPYLPYLDEFDQVLIMTVEPGFGGQKFLPDALAKVSRVAQVAGDSNLDLSIQVDGGIDPVTIGQAAKAGANSFVAGSSVYGSDDPRAQVGQLRTRAEQSLRH